MNNLSELNLFFKEHQDFIEFLFSSQKKQTVYREIINLSFPAIQNLILNHNVKISLIHQYYLHKGWNDTSLQYFKNRYHILDKKQRTESKQALSPIKTKKVNTHHKPKIVGTHEVLPKPTRNKKTNESLEEFTSRLMKERGLESKQ